MQGRGEAAGAAMPPSVPYGVHRPVAVLPEAAMSHLQVGCPRGVHYAAPGPGGRPPGSRFGRAALAGKNVRPLEAKCSWKGARNSCDTVKVGVQLLSGCFPRSFPALCVCGSGGGGSGAAGSREGRTERIRLRRPAIRSQLEVRLSPLRRGWPCQTRRTISPTCIPSLFPACRQASIQASALSHHSLEKATLLRRMVSFSQCTCVSV